MTAEAVGVRATRAGNSTRVPFRTADENDAGTPHDSLTDDELTRRQYPPELKLTLLERTEQRGWHLSVEMCEEDALRIAAGDVPAFVKAWLRDMLRWADSLEARSERAPTPKRRRKATRLTEGGVMRACIACGDADNGGYEVEDGPGPFCADCWERLTAERDRLQQEIADLKRLYAEYGATEDELAPIRRAEAAEAERDRARAALREYGQHKRDCAHDHSSYVADGCTCGLAARLTEGV